jgi:hypothetical protein
VIASLSKPLSFWDGRRKGAAQTGNSDGSLESKTQEVPAAS